MLPAEATRLVADALRALPPDPAVEETVITERIALHARLLGGMAQADPAVAMRFRSVGPSASAEQLKGIESNLRRLLDQLASLNGPAIDALAQSGILVADVSGTLSKVLVKMPVALEEAKGAVGDMGRPSDDFGRAVAAACALAYGSITGRRPTVSVDSMTSKASGPFLEFVDAVYQAVGADGRPEARAREAAGDWGKAKSRVENPD